MASKLGRNEPCPCGSGQKYKRCCLNSTPATRDISRSSINDNRFPLVDQEKTPDPLIHGYLKQEVYTTTFVYTEPLPNIGTEPRPDGYPGEYVVEFTLQPPSRVVMDSTEWKTDPDLPGGSLIAIANPLPRTDRDIATINVDVSFLPVDGTRGVVPLRYRFLPNEAGFLSTIKVNLYANSIIDAEGTATEHLAPILSEWAFIHDVPLDIARTRTEELATKTCECRYSRQAYLTVPINAVYIGRHGNVSQHYHPLVFYREALSATNPLYQYLCFYKVMELIGRLRQARVAEAKKAGTQPRVVTERLIRDAWLTKNVCEDLLNEVENRTFNDIRDKDLRPHRHKIAHALLDDECPLDTLANSAEELLSLSATYRLLPLTKYIARHMIKNEMGINVVDQ